MTSFWSQAPVELIFYWPGSPQLHIYIPNLAINQNVNRKVQGVPQSQIAANPRHQEEKWQKITRTKQTNKCTRSTQTSSLFPKQGYQNAKRNEETRGQREREDFKTWSPCSINHKATKNKNNTGTTALVPGSLKIFLTVDKLHTGLRCIS